jgi:3-methyladenine DNA glycosylase/8-oxoguanine DNA glycosylase
VPTRTYTPVDGPIALARTLFPLQRGRGDPTLVIERDRAVRAARTADGPATLALAAVGDRIEMEAWGAGAERALADGPALVGALDDWSTFRAHHEIVGTLRHRNPGLRLTRTGDLMGALIPAICEQKVTGQEARRAYRLMTRAVAEPAPGPFGLLLPPDPLRVAAMPSHAFHRWGLDGRRGETMRSVCRRASRIDALADRGLHDAKTALGTLPGVGAWTVAEVARLALGDPDAVSVGDFHVPSLVSWLLAREPRGDDARMLELLEPYDGHRGHVQLLLEASGVTAPRHGPRMEARSYADI